MGALGVPQSTPTRRRIADNCRFGAAKSAVDATVAASKMTETMYLIRLESLMELEAMTRTDDLIAYECPEDDALVQVVGKRIMQSMMQASDVAGLPDEDEVRRHLDDAWKCLQDLQGLGYALVTGTFTPSFGPDAPLPEGTRMRCLW